MGFFATLLGGGALQSLVSTLLPAIVSLVNDYTQNKITKEELAEKLQEAFLSAFAEVEKAYLDSITKTYTAFLQTTAQNPVMLKAWSIVLYSQLAVLIWHQVGIPAIVAFGIIGKYPPSGTTVDWAYALIALCLGVPALASRVGGGTAALGSTLKQLIGGSK